MVNETLLQKLVDHELGPEQRKSFIHSLEDHHWKSVAMAFVEHQILNEQIPSIAAEMNQPLITPSSLTADKKQEAESKRRTSFWNKTLAIVLAGLICAATGYFVASWSSPDGSTKTTASLDDPTSPKNLLSLKEALARCTMPIPEKFRLNLLEAGYVLTEDEKVSDVSLPFGGTVQIPVREVNVEYRGFDTFQ